MSDIYEPDNQFVERLEWQLSSEYRRANRLKSSPEKIALPRRLVTIACVAGILITGVAMIKAAEYIKDSWRKKIEVARAETEVKIKEAYLESARENQSRAKIRLSEGMIREEEYRAIEIAAEKAGLDLEISLVNLDEVKASGSIPRNELNSPLLRGRDFVSERLNIEKKEAELELDQLDRHLKRLKEMAAKDMISEHEVEPIRAEFEARKQKIDQITEQLALRRRFIEGEISAQEAEIMERLTAAEKNMRLAQTKIESLTAQMKRLKALESKGMISPLEVKQLQYALDTAQAELNLAALEMDVLKKLK